MACLSREEMIAKAKKPFATEVVKTDTDWGDITIGVLSVAEKDSFDRLLVEAESDRKAGKNPNSVTARLLLATIVDEKTNERKFSESDLEHICMLPSVPFSRVCDAAMKLNGIGGVTEEDHDNAVGKSEATGASDSVSD